MNIYQKVLLGFEYCRTSLVGFKKPLFVSWQITERCNLNCQYCMSSGNAQDELGSREILETVDCLRGMGTRLIRFTGGEPLLRNDLVTIIRHCDISGILVGLASNGLLFPHMVGELRSLSTVSFSLDGPENIHNLIRGPGSHKSVMLAIEAAKKNNIYTTISVTLSKLNIGCIKYILKLAADFQIKVFFQPATFMMLCGGNVNPIAPDILEFKQAMYLLINEKKNNKYIGNSSLSLKHLSCWPQKTPIKCVAGKIILRINADGRILACPRFKDKSDVCNLKYNNIKDCFDSLSSPNCNECWCSLFVELNLLSSFQPRVLLEALAI